MNIGDHNENDYKILEELADPDDPDKQFHKISRPTPSELVNRVNQIESTMPTLKGLLVKTKRALEPENLKYKLDNIRLGLAKNVNSARKSIGDNKVKKSIDGFAEKAKSIFTTLDSEQFRNNLQIKMTSTLKLDKIKGIFDSLALENKQQPEQASEGYEQATIETTPLHPQPEDTPPEQYEPDVPLSKRQ